MASMDRKLVASEQHYEVAYFARKISVADARSILLRAGRSREKASALAVAEKQK